ncbi:MAG: zinc ribbon domain-containing protein, partial [Clostridia bacterium]|nr:zinc ribbon domain-containing protein [Clostridia bacterium]
MFCGNCGAQNADNAAFCKNCGAQLNAAPQQPQQQPVYQQPVYQQPYYAAPKKPLNTKLIGIIAGAAASVVLVVVLLIVLLGGGGVAGSPEEVVGNYIDAMLNYDTDDLLALVPDAALDYAAQNEGFDDIDEMRENLEAGEDSMDAMMDMLDDYDISYEVLDVTNYKKLDLQDV